MSTIPRVAPPSGAASVTPTIRPQLAVTPLSRLSGAVVTGIDLARPLDDATVAELERLVTSHGMIAVPDQRLDEATHLALAGRFGTVSISPLRRLLGSERRLAVIEDSAERPPAGFDWHTDESWTEHPPQYGFLHALTIPPFGGDTIWANTAAAYDRLPASLRRLADELQVVHHMGADYLRTVVRHHGQRVADALAAAHPPVVHPLVRRQPRTGNPALWLSPLYQQHIVGVDDATSRSLLDLFGRTLEDPHVQARWRWSAGDVVIWDEAATCHRALVDHHPSLRRMRRGTTDGPRPVGIR